MGFKKKAHNENKKFPNTLSKKAQVQITFNWIYILVAGAVILLFFVALIVRQKDVSEQNLAGDIVNIMESIFTGAQVSEKTKNSIPTGGLSDKTLYFNCEEGVGEYGVVGLPARTQNSLEPIFAPSHMRGSRLLLWSLPYYLPFKITDFLFVTSINNRYFFIGDKDGFTEEFLEGALDEDPKLSINSQQVTNPSEIIVKDVNLQVRIIDVEGGWINHGDQIRANVNDKVILTAVSFTANNEVNFFKRNGKTWEKLNQAPISLVSKGGRRDAVKYGAIFADDPDVYLCNMKKAYKRIRLISEVYEGKVEELEIYYQNPTESGSCLGFISGFISQEGNVKDALTLYKTRAKACSILADNSCNDIIDHADRLKILNENLADECSVTLY